MKSISAIFMIAIYVINTGALGQITLDTSASPSCPTPADTTPVHLYGIWHAEFDKLPRRATLLFEKHPEFSGSVNGGINRDGVLAMIVGDVEQGEFSLEESHDGQHISATWLGTVVEKSCGMEIRGTWNDISTRASHPFVLLKLPGSQ